MKKLFFAISALCLLASCSKQKDQVGPSPSGKTKKLVKASYVYDNNAPEGAELTYDGQGRLSVYVDDDRRYEFDYQSATFLKVLCKKKSDNSLIQTLECDLNDKGAITQIIYKNPLGAMIYRYQYTYDSDGHVTTVKGSPTLNDDYEERYVIVNGNAVSSKVYYGGVLYHNREYSFDTKANKAPFGSVGLWPVEKLFGKPNTNNFVEFKDYDPNNVLTWHTKAAYEFDADGYPTKITTQYVLQGKTEIATYTFQ